jgi:hypothetical protein
MQCPQQVWFIFINISSTLSILPCTNLRCKIREMEDVYYMTQWVLLCNNTSSSQDPVVPVPSAMIRNNSLSEVKEARKLLEIRSLY